MAFIFGGDTGMSYEDIQRKRQVADSLMGSAIRPARNVGEGLAAIGAALAVRGIEKRTKAADEENRMAFNDQWGSIFGGGSPDVVTQAVNPQPVDPMDPQAIASDTMNALGKHTFPASLIETESGGNWGASNNVTGAGGKAGHFGRLQFGQARLEDAKRAGVIPADMTPDQFMASPAAQMAVEQWHFGDINSRIDAAGLGQYEGQVIGGVPMTRDGMLAMAHLGGFGGLQKFVESNGQYNPADAYGTSLADYGVRHGGGQPIRTAQAGNFDLATLAELAGNPYASPGQKAVLQALIGQQTAAMDPMRALEMERARLEIEGLRNPQAKPTATMQEYEFARGQGYEGTFADYKRDMAAAGRSNTTVNVGGDGAPGLGKLSTDYGYVLDPATGKPVIDPQTGLPKAAPVPGSPAAREIETAENAGDRKTDNAMIASETVTNAAARAREAAKNRDFGGAGTTFIAGLPIIGSRTDSGEVVRQVEVLRATAKVGNLQAMRDASPTGGALGAVTEKELKMLEDKSGALDPNSPYFERDLADYERTLLRTIHGTEEGDRIFEATRNQNDDDLFIKYGVTR